MRIGKTDKPGQPDDQKELEKRVDTIMNETTASPPDKPAKAAKQPKTDAKPDTAEAKQPAKQQKTAPDLPDKLLKTIHLDKAPKAKKSKRPPIVMALADEPETKVEVTKKDAKPDEPEAPEEATEETQEEAEVADEPQPEPAADPAPGLPEPESVDLNDNDTDQAVDEIIAKEGNTQLAVEDAIAARHKAARSKEPSAFGEVFFNKWTWITVIAISALALGFALLLTGF